MSRGRRCGPITSGRPPGTGQSTPKGAWYSGQVFGMSPGWRVARASMTCRAGRSSVARPNRSVYAHAPRHDAAGSGDHLAVAGCPRSRGQQPQLLGPRCRWVALEAARQLRFAVTSFVDAVWAGSECPLVLMSGSEDSRLVAALAARGRPRGAVRACCSTSPHWRRGPYGSRRVPDGWQPQLAPRSAAGRGVHLRSVAGSVSAPLAGERAREGFPGSKRPGTTGTGPASAMRTHVAHPADRALFTRAPSDDSSTSSPCPLHCPLLALLTPQLHALLDTPASQ